MGLLKDKVALITGGTSGVGRSTALLFAREGAHVIVAGRRISAGTETVEEIRQAGHDVEFQRADISVAADVAALVDAIVRKHGRIDVAFNNAAVGSSGALIVDTAEEEFDRLIAIDLKGAFLCLKHQIPALTRPGASVIFTSSIASLSGSRGRAVYSAAKGGINAFARAAAIELAGDGIRVNVIAPAGIVTPMSAAYFERAAAQFGGMQAVIDASNAMHPLGRMAQPADIAQTALFLASAQSGMITGQILPVDGGMSASSPLK